jgi:hypothetical protein
MTNVKEKLAQLFQGMVPGARVSERELERQFSSAKRAQKEVHNQLSNLLSEGYILRLGTGHRGNPFRYILSLTWPYNKCPFCGHVEYPKPLQSEKTDEQTVTQTEG